MDWESFSSSCFKKVVFKAELANLSWLTALWTESTLWRKMTATLACPMEEREADSSGWILLVEGGAASAKPKRRAETKIFLNILVHEPKVWIVACL